MEICATENVIWPWRTILKKFKEIFSWKVSTQTSYYSYLWFGNSRMLEDMESWKVYINQNVAVVKITGESIKFINVRAMSHRWFHNSRTQFVVYDWSVLRSDSEIYFGWFSKRNKGIVQAEVNIKISASILRKRHSQLGGKSFRECTWHNMESYILVLNARSNRIWTWNLLNLSCAQWRHLVNSSLVQWHQHVPTAELRTHWVIRLCEGNCSKHRIRYRCRPGTRRLSFEGTSPVGAQESGTRYMRIHCVSYILQNLPKGASP